MDHPKPQATHEAIKEALLAGKKIFAIKLYREQNHVGLAEAKAAVEKLEAELGIAPVCHPKPQATQETITDALFAGKKILAIKFYRELNKVGLAEAKTAVEKMEAELRASSPGQFTAPPTTGCFTAIVAIGLVGAALWKALA